MDQKNPELTKIQSQPKKGKLVLGKILAVAGVLLVLCIIIGGALLASHVINPSWNPFKQNPDKGIRDKVIQIKHT